MKVELYDVFIVISIIFLMLSACFETKKMQQFEEKIERIEKNLILKE